jgi:hypothetical protein
LTQKTQKTPERSQKSYLVFLEDNCLFQGC